MTNSRRLSISHARRAAECRDAARIARAIMGDVEGGRLLREIGADTSDAHRERLLQTPLITPPEASAHGQ